MSELPPPSRPEQPAFAPRPLTEDVGYEALQELGDLADRFRALAETPDELVAWLRADDEVAMRVARADTVVHLRRWFTPTGGWRHEPDRSGAVGPAAAGVEWRFEAVHDRPGAFNGLPASNRPVAIRGFTLFSAEPSRLAVRRFVDWAGVFGQLGLTVNWRLPVPSA